MPLFSVISSLFQHTSTRADLIASSSNVQTSLEIRTNLGLHRHAAVHPAVHKKPARSSQSAHRSPPHPPAAAGSPHRRPSPLARLRGLAHHPRHPSPSPPRGAKPPMFHKKAAGASHSPPHVQALSQPQQPQQPQQGSPAGSAPANDGVHMANGVRIGPSGGVDYDGGATAAGKTGGNGGRVMSDSQLPEERARLFADINKDRAQHGLAPLQESTTLDAEAEHRSSDMIQRNYFNHLIPDGGQGHYFMSELPSAPQHYGENVAENDYVPQGMSKDKAMDQSESDFMNSPEHRVNVLNSNFGEVGIGVAYDKNGQMKLTEDFTN